MSVRVLSRVMRDSQATLAARLVLFVLADAAHDDGVTWVPLEEIAAKAKIAKSTTSAALDTLAELGEVERRKAQRGRRRISVYRVALADVEPDYDQLPFTVNEPFTTSDIRNPPTGDDFRSAGLTTSDLPSRVCSNRNENRKKGGANAPPAGGSPSAPPLVLVDGRNLAFDALAEECSIDPASNRTGLIVAALNTSNRGKRSVGIRDLFRTELGRWAERHDPGSGAPQEWLAGQMAGNPERFERGLAETVRRKAALYRSRMPGVFLTPTALRDHWLDLELAQQRSPSGGLTPEAILRLGQDAA